MKVLSEEEGKNLQPFGKGRFTQVHAMLSQLRPGESLVIERKDWVTKYPPYKVIRRAAEKFNFQFSYGRMHDGSGWFAKRLG